MLYARLLRPLLFRLSAGDPERAHEQVMHLLARAGHSPLLAAALRALYPPVRSRRLRQRLFGLTFSNPVGLAAGFDKNAMALPALAALGFGFIEAGTVTYHAQPGNPRPRIVRLPEQCALINRMGFNNDGAAVVARRLAGSSRPPVPLGISLGKSRVTPLERAVEDYRASYRLLAPHADYVAINVSSPNTPNLRSLQEREQVDALLSALQAEAAAVAQQSARPQPPLLVKVSPDLTNEALEELLEVCLARDVDGVIAVNTTVDLTPRPLSLARKGVPRQTAAEQEAIGVSRPSELVPTSRPGTPFLAREGGRGVRFTGGLSGRPLFPRALEVVRHIRAVTGGRLPIIAVGGIFSAADAYAMIRAGAGLVQVYTGMIYEGPAIARQINRGLLRLLERDGLSSIDEASGSAC